MSTEEIVTEYGEKRHWPHFEELIENVNNIGGRLNVHFEELIENVNNIGGRLKVH